MKVQINVLLALVVALCGCDVSVSTSPPEPLAAPTAGTEAQQREAFQAVRSVVLALDRGEFGSVWDQSSEMMKGSSSRLVFIGFMSTTRAKLGAPAPRPAPRMGFATQVDPGGPKGEYVVAAVDTNFSGTIITEKVVMMREHGQWKLAGYFMSSQHKIASWTPGGPSQPVG